MPVFVILSEAPQPTLRAAIERVYPERHFHWSDTVSFVRAVGSAKAVSTSLGIKSRDGEGNVTGSIASVVVSQLSSSYHGWSKNALWDWLKAAFEAAD
jgi:hypothetical protein